MRALEYGWRHGRDPLSGRDVLVIDEAGMVGCGSWSGCWRRRVRPAPRWCWWATREQLQAIEAGAAFRALAERDGAAEITAVRRQREAWQREATPELAHRRTAATALAAYAARGQVRLAESREAAKAALRRDGVADCASGGRVRTASQRDPGATRAPDVRGAQRAGAGGAAARLASWARTRRVPTARGERQFAAGDRLVFLRNERGLGVKNGTLATVEQAAPGRLVVRLDGGGRVGVEQAVYAQIDHGYAVTIHKAQGATVERAFVLASGGMDRHLAYVGDDAAPRGGDAVCRAR